MQVTFFLIEHALTQIRLKTEMPLSAPINKYSNPIWYSQKKVDWISNPKIILCLDRNYGRFDGIKPKN